MTTILPGSHRERPAQTAGNASMLVSRSPNLKAGTAKSIPQRRRKRL